MKNLICMLMVAIMFAACQNSTSTSTSTPQDAAATAVITPEAIKERMDKSKANVENMTQIKQAAEAAKLVAPEAAQAELESITANLDDLLEKQTMMTKGLEAAANPSSGNAPTQTVLEDYMKSVENYNEEVDRIKARVEEIKSGKTKQN